MNTHTTRITIGTKPAEAIAAEYAADFKTNDWKPRPPNDKPGWIESTDLRERLGLNVYAFKTRAHQLVTAKLYEMDFGTKIGANGKPCRSVYYRRVAATPALHEDKARRLARRGR
jgi:hypothetical protein